MWLLQVLIPSLTLLSAYTVADLLCTHPSTRSELRLLVDDAELYTPCRTITSPKNIARDTPEVVTQGSVSLTSIVEYTGLSHYEGIGSRKERHNKLRPITLL